jgi:hypothetical protein
MHDYLSRSSVVIAGTAGAIYHIIVFSALATVLA